jgi:hypothetical protein
MVMQPAYFRDGKHHPRFRWLDRARFWTIHDQGKMGSPPMIIGKVVGQDAPQMPLVQDEHMLETLPADAPDEALDIGILPRTSGGDEVVALDSQCGHIMGSSSFQTRRTSLHAMPCKKEVA